MEDAEVTPNELDELDLYPKCPICEEATELSSQINRLAKTIRQAARNQNPQLYQRLARYTRGMVKLRRVEKNLDDLPAEAKGKKEKIQAARVRLSIKLVPLRKRIEAAEDTAFQATDGPVLRARLLAIGRRHPLCKGCALLFGDGHLARPTGEFRGFSICQYCVSELSTWGAKWFAKQIKQSTEEEP